MRRRRLVEQGEVEWGGGSKSLDEEVASDKSKRRDLYHFVLSLSLSLIILFTYILSLNFFLILINHIRCCENGNSNVCRRRRRREFNRCRQTHLFPTLICQITNKRRKCSHTIFPFAFLPNPSSARRKREEILSKVPVVRSEGED